MFAPIWSKNIHLYSLLKFPSPFKISWLSAKFPGIDVSTYFFSLYDHTCSHILFIFTHISWNVVRSSGIPMHIGGLYTVQCVLQKYYACYSNHSPLVGCLKPMCIKTVGGATSSINHAKVVVLAWHGGFASRRDNYFGIKTPTRYFSCHPSLIAIMWFMAVNTTSAVKGAADVTFLMQM